MFGIKQNSAALCICEFVHSDPYVHVIQLCPYKEKRFVMLRSLLPQCCRNKFNTENDNLKFYCLRRNEKVTPKGSRCVAE